MASPKPEPQLDALGIFWIVWAVVWTLIVAAGMGFLWVRRDMPMLRVRGLPLSFAAIILLHLYWGGVQGGYCYGPIWPSWVEFWIMNIWLPCGIALFHASNSRFLYVASTQRRFFAADVTDEKQQLSGSRRNRAVTGWTPPALVRRFRAMDFTTRILSLVGAGMAFQIFLAVFMFCISRKFHPSWGIPGTEATGTESQIKHQQGRGWEWWPSVFWQFLWAWIVAPVVLWKARRIHDTQGWRVQTIGCCIASLHATPMWLVALYVPAMAGVSSYFIPPQWIALSIMMLEIFTIFLPCWEVLRHQTLRQETLDSIAQWESNNRAAGRSTRSVITGSTTMAGSAFTAWTKDGSVKSAGSSESILTMGALEYVLARNPEPLQKFSALRDFSGENIAFLRAVAEWKSSLPPAVRDPLRRDELDTQALVRERFNSALRIYTNFISARDAEFQVNLSSVDLKKLEAIFEPSARILYGEKREVDPATPFDAFAMPTVDAHKVRSRDDRSTDGSEAAIVMATEADHIGDRALYWGEIPDTFDETVFDDSEASIKYLVLTNTWPKFVKDRRCSIDSEYTNLEAGL